MAKYIAHASIDENGKIAGGKAGDSTKKEVCIRTFYVKPWNAVIRINNAKVRKQFANNMIDLANNNNVGYNQGKRNTLLKEAEKVNFDFSKIKTKCDCDCSSAITICLLGAIYTVLGELAYKKAYTVLVLCGNCATTKTLIECLKKLTLISVTVYTSKSYISGTSKAVFGDIYIKEGSHVVCYIDDGKKAGTSSSTSSSTKYALDQFIREVQKATGSEVDGEARDETIGNTVTVSRTKNKNHAVVTPLERRLKALGYYTGKIEADSGKTPCFGSGMENAVNKYQKTVLGYKDPDGEITAKEKMWKSLLGMI